MHIRSSIYHSHRLASDRRWGRGYRSGRPSVVGKSEVESGDGTLPAEETAESVGSTVYIFRGSNARPRKP